MAAGDVVEPPAFPNGTSFRMWQSQYCNRCWHDRMARPPHNRPEDGCELILLGMMHEVVPQWIQTDADLPPANVHCTKFTPDDGGGDDEPRFPKPRPTPKNQLPLFDGDPFIDSPTDIVDQKQPSKVT